MSKSIFDEMTDATLLQASDESLKFLSESLDKRESELKGRCIDLLREIHAERIKLAHYRIAQLEAELKAKELVYTSEKPTVKGWWWYRASKTDRAFPIQLLRDESGDLYTVISAGLDAYVSHMDGEFAGPIPQPK